DRDRQIGQFLLGEHGRSGLEVDVRHGGVGDASDGFGPGKSGAFAWVKQAAGLAPRLDQDQLFDGEALLNQVTRVHIDAIGATVDLRGAQINHIHQQPGQARLRNVAINTAERLYTGRGDGCVI